MVLESLIIGIGLGVCLGALIGGLVMRGPITFLRNPFSSAKTEREFLSCWGGLLEGEMHRIRWLLDLIDHRLSYLQEGEEAAENVKKVSRPANSPEQRP